MWVWLDACLCVYATTTALGAGEALRAEEEVTHVSKLLVLEGRSEEPVVSNVTELRLVDAHTGDTGWLMQTELSFTRNPPLYWERDESIDLSCVLMLYRAKGETRRPPLRVGHVVRGHVLVQGSAKSELDIPVVPLVNQSQRALSFLRRSCIISMTGGVFLQDASARLTC